MKEEAENQEDCKNVEQNNTSVALNVLFVSHESEEIKLPYTNRIITSIKIK